MNLDACKVPLPNFRHSTDASLRLLATSNIGSLDLTPLLVSEAGGKRHYRAEGRRKLKQSDGEDDTTGLSGSLRLIQKTPDLSDLEVSKSCWLPTVECSYCVNELFGRFAFQRALGPDLIVVQPLVLYFLHGMPHAHEPVGVQAFVA